MVMKIYKFSFTILLLVMAFFSCSSLGQGGGYNGLDIRQGTVKIFKTSVRPSFYVPWRMYGHSSSKGSGAIIKGNRILTNAHVVADATILQVQKENDPVKYKAEVLYIAHDCDLALLIVEDPSFFEGTRPIPLSDIVPDLQTKVATFGFPLGGQRISITEGVVSRIELNTYSHSNKGSALTIQTDAAINPGNSGGPVVQKGNIVGIAFQSQLSADNIGFMIPIPVINRFFKDIEDGVYDGIPSMGIMWDNLENPDFRNSLEMDDSMTGIHINGLSPGSPVSNYLKAGDVILSIDGIKIANDGSMKFKNGRLLFTYLITLLQAGDSVEMKILRDTKVQSFMIPVNDKKERIVWYDEYETLPRYYIYGGIIFQPLNREYLKSWKEWWNNADFQMLYYFFYNSIDNLKPEREEFVVINQILPDKSNTYVSSRAYEVVDNINGMQILKLEDVVEAFKKDIDGYHVIETDGYNKPIILKAEEAEAANSLILESYGITQDRRLEG